MDMSITDAAAMLADLVRRAEAGEEVVLTRDGMPVVQISAFGQRLSDEAFDALVDELQDIAATTAIPSNDAAHSQDFLYDENGLPG